MTPELEAILRGHLTTAQFDAAADESAEVLALACAGSGKSRTLAFRIARLIGDGEDAASMVAFTFTEKAAEAIKLRVTQALAAAGEDPRRVGRMYIGTIHAYCQGILGLMDARYRQFEVLDDNRLKLFLVSRYPALGMQPLRQRANGRYFEAINRVADAWKTLNDELLAIDDVSQYDAELGLTLRRLEEKLDIDEYLDFSSMIRIVVDALRERHPGAETAIAGIRHLMVDEYQDVNPAQEALIQQIRQRCRTLFVVGDDDQAIYGWRGAEVANITGFSDRYPACSQHTLSHNFRSTPAIVQSADAFARVELGPERVAKHPEAGPTEEPRDFRNLWFDNRAEEAGWVGERIKALLGTAYREADGAIRGLTPSDFAILMRSTRQNESDESPRHHAYTALLAQHEIPYSLEAGGSIFDRPQVEALRGTFELLRNGEIDRETARGHFDAAIVPAYPHARFDAFVGVLAKWTRLIHTPRGGVRRRVYPQGLVYELLDAFGIRTTAMDSGAMQDIGIFSRIIQDVETVYLSIDSAGRFNEICNFLQNVAERGYDSGTDEILRRPDTVTVSTVHKMKGLEFPVVFIVDVESGRFPGRNHRYEGWLPLPLIQAALDRGAYQSNSAEEARLFYTAMTRAERFLYVTGSRSLPGAVRPRKPSNYALRLAHSELEVTPNGAPVPAPAAQVRRIDETIVPTTYSDIRYYLKCPRDYQFRKVFRFSPPITEMFGFGQTVHAALGKLHQSFPDAAPDPDDAERIARRVFHLKHVPPSSDPVNRPGAFERGCDSAAQILRTYSTSYGADFARRRQVEARFEVPIRLAVVTGSIDLLLLEDEQGNILEASVIDFKAMEGGDDPDENPELEWTELALQVQLYAMAAREVLGENARTGAVHLLKDNQRVEVPVDDAAIAAAVANVEWSVNRVVAGDFPMRPEPKKCGACDFRLLCPQVPQEFAVGTMPPAISIPGQNRTEMALAFSRFKPA